MTFLAGAIVGVVVGFVAAGLLARGRGSANGAAPASRDRGLAVAIGIATIALVVAAVALARSDQGPDGTSTTTSALAATSSSALAATTSTVSPTTTSAMAVVPNVVGLARDDAVAALTVAGLKSTIQVLSLANVPPGFVISQNPLAASSVATGSTVTLMVSAAG